MMPDLACLFFYFRKVRPPSTGLLVLLMALFTHWAAMGKADALSAF